MLSSMTKEDAIHNLKTPSQNTGDGFRDTLSEAKDDLSATANKVGRKVRSFVDSAEDEFTHVRKTVTEHVHEKPVQSSFIALGIGFVLGALLRR